MGEEHRIRIDPVLVHKFQRIPGGVPEIGTKIMRDLGLQFHYDKHSHNLDIIGPHPEILSLAIETLRFWVEDDDYPNTGITCQVGYPNKCMVIWRYHGDYAKKLDHLFTEDINRLKQIPTVNVKAVPSKRNPEYVEIYCHFTVYDQVKDEIIRLSSELSRISQDDFFVPYSDFMKARRFARSKADDGSVLYALKEYPDRNRVRVWIFGREQIDVIRAKKDWIQHVGNISNDAEFKETIVRDGGVNTARFYGHPSASTSRDSFSPHQSNLQRSHPKFQQNSPRNDPHGSQRGKQATFVTSKNLSVSLRSASTVNRGRKKSVGVVIPEVDNRNYPRPSNFVYPIEAEPVPDPPPSFEELAYQSNPFNQNELRDIQEETRLGTPENKIVTQSGWEEGSGTKYPSKLNKGKMAPNRIYVHYQVHNQNNVDDPQAALAVKQVVHPETNLMPKERYKTRNSERILTSVTDPKLAPAVKRNKNMRPGAKKQLQPKAMAFTRQKPVLQAKKPQNIRYHINVNGLDIYMYKHNLAKLNDMEAIVNVVSGDIRPGGHLAANVLEMAGPQVADEIRVYLNIYGSLRVAENMVSSAGRLPVLGIIHVAGPVWENYLNISEEECARDLHKAIYGSLKTAEKHKYRKIGMPVISSEPYFGVPQDLLAEVYVKALVDYSMGMGPLYPVLEIHLVDVDIGMLTHIKDAYEKWSTDYNMVGVTQQFKSDLPNQSELSERGESAVTLKELPSHRSENMVTFTEQSYTAEGNQMWTFDVLKKLVVHVYTGSIVRLRDVEAMVCGVNPNLKGSLANQFANVGGIAYEVALKRARGDRDLIEGDVLVSEAGSLATDLVMHSIVRQPIQKINEKNLVRLDRIYSQVLQAANKLTIESLAMPLIGTGRLRERFEVEQCSLQLIDNVIELCLSQGHALKIRELHLVNVNNVMTQALTQALRTRAHTKLRLETDPHPPSRQEVLSLPDHMMQTPDLQKSLLSARKPTETDLAEEFKNLADMQRHGKTKMRQYKTIEDMNKAIMGKARSEKTATLDDKVTESVTIDKVMIKMTEGKVEAHASSRDEKQLAYNLHSGNYLSKENLKVHERMLSNAVAPEPAQGKELETAGHSRQPSKTDTPGDVRQEKKEKKTPKEKQPDETQNGGLFTASKTKKRKRLPPVTGLVPQSSRAESYRSIYIRRQKIAAQMIKDQHVPVRRTHSASNLHENGGGQDQFRIKTVKRLKTKPVKGGDDDDMREKFQRESQNYFTRGTKDRYRSTRSENKADVPSTSRLPSNEDKEPLVRNHGSVTERLGMDRKVSRKHLKERVLWDKEREDMYMKDMDRFVLANNEAIQDRNSRPEESNENELPATNDKPKTKQIENDEADTNIHRDTEKTDPVLSGNGGNKDIQTVTESKQVMQNSPKSVTFSETHRDHSVKDDQQYPHKAQVPAADDIVNTKQHEEVHQHEIMTLNMTKPQPLNHEIQSYQTTHTKPAQSGVRVFNQSQGKEVNKGETKKEEEGIPAVDMANLTDDAKARNTTSGVTHSDTTRSTKSKPVKLVISSELFQRNIDDGNHARSGRSVGPIDTNISNTSGVVDTRAEDVPTDARRRASAKTTASRSNAQSVTPRAEDVVIRDKLTVEIDVADNITRESSNITREKAKIKRFWEVVGGKDVDNDAGIYGDNNKPDSEKVLTTRVTKERKMSARSKNSKHTDSTNIANKKIGKYNVTVDVI